MQEIARIEISFLIHDGKKKIMTNVISGNRAWGFIRSL